MANSDLPLSPFAPQKFPPLATISGLKFVSLDSQERCHGRDDVLVMALDDTTHAAAIFTQSLAPGAPVVWSRKVHSQGQGRAMIVTAGNANVCTGEQGEKNAQSMAQAVARIANVDLHQVFVSSTGVIGEQMNIDRILTCLPKQIEAQDQNWEAAARAIMTTDTYPKGASEQLMLDDVNICISGIAKGSGMIEPNMATMLSYIFTDANIAPDVLQIMLKIANVHSFNSITVDSDTSTSDTCLLFATGKAKNDRIEDINSAQAQQFLKLLQTVMQDLAQQVVKDGEGAQKFITVHVSGAVSDESARIIAKSIANSPLVKTAIAGEDANWGRIVMAVGKANQAINFSAMATSMGGVLIAKGNGPLAGYDESKVTRHLQGKEIDIDVDVGLGSHGVATVWTCDLTHGYIDINADYRS